MKIDCSRCPARGRECGDCMMGVLFGPVTSGYAMGEVPDPDGVELLYAIDVFADTDLISIEVADLAIRDVSAGEGHFEANRSLRLRAV
ncbi:MAG: hypothetical protein GX543_11185 [Gordonia sp.]|nr:hypothetical protein [Gordonia sp. (in: high G+C Gram-positive bacteria)]